MKIKKEHIGQRLLIKEDRYMAEPVEAGLLEVSPSGKYLKIQFVRSDNTTYNEWVESSEYELVEVLGSKMDELTKMISEFEKQSDDFFKSYNPIESEIPLYDSGIVGDKPYWENMPKSFCSDDIISPLDSQTSIGKDADDLKPCCKAKREKAVKDFNETLKKVEQHAQELKKSNWVHGMCNPPSPDWKKY